MFLKSFGIVTPKPIGGLVTNNPATTAQEQINRQKEAAELAERLKLLTQNVSNKPK